MSISNLNIHAFTVLHVSLPACLLNDLGEQRYKVFSGFLVNHSLKNILTPELLMA